MKITIEQPSHKEQIDISFVEWVKLKALGRGYYKHVKKKGWDGSLPLYISYCPKHNHYFMDYPHGYEGSLYCDLCIEELKNWREI